MITCFVMADGWRNKIAGYHLCALVNELVKYNKLFSMMSYPMRDHSISQGENTTLHMRRTMEKFWKNNL